MKTWSEVIQQSAYSSMKPEEKRNAREAYFSELVKEQGAGMSKEDIKSQYNEFIEYTKEVDPQIELGEIIENPDGSVSEVTGIDVQGGPWEAAKSGYQQSATGTWTVPKPEDGYYQPEGTLERVSSMAGQLAGDFPWMVAGSILGGGPASPLTAAGGAFALPEALKTLGANRQELGPINSVQDFIDRLSQATYAAEKGFATGGTSAGLAQPFTGPVAKTAAEIAGMIGAGSALEMKMPKPSDIIDAVLMVGAMKGIPRVTKLSKGMVDKISEKLVKKSEELGKQPTEVLSEIMQDPSTHPWFEQIAGLEEGRGIMTPQALESVFINQGQKILGDKVRSALNTGEVNNHTKPIYEAVLGDSRLAPYGDTQKIIRQKDHTNRNNPEMMPMYEAEAVAMLDIPDLVELPYSKWLENPVRTFERLGAVYKRMFYDRIKAAEYLAHNEQMKIINERRSLIKELGIDRNSEERIGVYAIAEQESGKNILRTSSPKIYKKYQNLIEGKERLTSSELEMYSWYRTKYERYFDRLNDARTLAGISKIDKVENYFTFVRNMGLAIEYGMDPATIRLVKLRESMGSFDNPIYKYYHPRTEEFGSIKRRIYNEEIPVEINSGKIFEKYIMGAEPHIIKAPAIAKGRELIRKLTPDEMAKIEGMTPEKIQEMKFEDGYHLQTDKPQTHAFLQEWMDSIAGKSEPERYYAAPPKVVRTLGKLNRNLAFAILSYNLRAAIIQPTSYVNTVTELGIKYAKGGIYDIMDPAKREFAKKNSNVLQPRLIDVTLRGMRESIPGRIGEVRNKIAKGGLKPLLALDNMAATATWLSAYRYATEKIKLKGRDAYIYADDIVTKTQASASRADLSKIQRNILGKTATMFQTFVINNYGFLKTDVLGYRSTAPISKKEIAKKTLTWVVLASLVNDFYENVMNEFMPHEIYSPFPSPVYTYVRSKKEGKSNDRAAIDALASIADLVPVVGGATRVNRSMLGPTVDIAENLRDMLVDPRRYFSMGRTLETVGKIAGVPGTVQAAKLLRDKKKKPVKTGFSPLGKL